MLNDIQIEEYCNQGLITPFNPKQKQEGVISFGLSGFGYDVRLGNQFKTVGHQDIIVNSNNEIVDKSNPIKFAAKEKHDWAHSMNPLSIDGENFRHYESRDPKSKSNSSEFTSDNPVMIPANDVLLGQSLEYFKLPNNIICLPTGKSTYARTGLICNVTPFDPGWEGYATIALVNPTAYPIVIYPGEGILQCLFVEAEPARESYADKGGKYHQADGIQTSRIKEG